MRILWICNMMIPMIAKPLEETVSVKEGWISGLAAQVLSFGNDIEFGIAFPFREKLDRQIENIRVFGFREDTTHPEVYDNSVYEDIEELISKYNPDVIHAFGTEYPHTLMCLRAAKKLGIENKVLVGIQGVMSVISQNYYAGLPTSIVRKKTFRDLLKRDSLIQQKEKFLIRALYEQETLKIARNVTGRTEFDKKEMMKVNPDLIYYKMCETLRTEFYEGEWDPDKCTAHSIFMSQGNYPIKGAHFAIEALKLVREQFPDATLNIAGDDITRYNTLKDKIKISGYGKYLRKLIDDNGLQKAVLFLGSLDAGKMKTEYLKTHVFLCASVVENSPNSVGEAMLLGTPVVSSNVGGINDMLVPDKEGLYFAWDSPKDMADRIIQVFTEQEAALLRSKCAKEHAKDTHCGKRNFERMMEIYRSI